METQRERQNQETKLQELEKELQKLGKELTKLKEEYKEDNKELKSRMKEVEDKYFKLELLIAEIKQDIRYSNIQMEDIKNITNTQLKEQRAFYNKAYLYVIITICSALLILIGANPEIITKILN
ncbi:hypothetical protein SAMN05661008_00324 [Alkalithermobacter thermoalcaliphilus JW-YL-7 = DSM 7308]|uniref:Uncharacterized protein n=1 Tax=Alkalithermobacter thermoalcaliphilus JW-YL-7 = DSM 7308 TaxID=1121328 RepID=A0A150FR22_CLOPD|nr:hypothetical protein JWYL7_0565 [[Clostridium] paradoxum JW-YL-7 = DSM 7308]SHK49764.1 hypothetical protein SAMN05661008_00324 [[Clostridium] paradoxum JW-YL-7 = DSM 7308]